MTIRGLLLIASCLLTIGALSFLWSISQDARVCIMVGMYIMFALALCYRLLWWLPHSRFGRDEIDVNHMRRRY